jgi:aminoglycoside phosphotransferase (APT) family kinase protein
VTGLPPAAAAWVAEELGAEVDSTAVLTGGVASQMFAVTTVDGRQAVLRRLTEDPWLRFAEPLLRREQAVQSLLASTDVPAPSTIAVDTDGSRAGAPSLLMTRLPGRVDLRASDPVHLAGLAAMLVRIHRHRPGSWPRDYESWARAEKQLVPPWSRADVCYAEAFARINAPAPPYRRTFLHRDYHPGNVLWDRGEVSGVVDWVETSTGPADLDVAHCVSNLAGLHGVDAAAAFRSAYVDAGGVLDPDPDAARYWQLLDLVAFLPAANGREGGASPATVTALWRAAGRPDLDLALVRRRREDLLRVVLSPGWPG